MNHKSYAKVGNRQAFQRPLILVAIYIFIIAVSFLVSILSHAPLKSILNSPSLLITFSLFSILSILAPFIYLHYQQQYDYSRLAVYREQFNHLKMLTQGTLEIEDLDHLLKLIPRFLMHMYITSMNIVLSHASVFFYDSVTKSYLLVAQRGREKPLKFYITEENPLVVWFTKEVPYLIEKRYFSSSDLEVLRYEDIDYLLSQNYLLNREPEIADLLRKLKDELSQLRARLCVPCFYQKECMGFLILGNKPRGSFLKEEIDALATLSHYIAMSIRSAKLREELVSSYFEAIHGIVKSLEARDTYTKGHSERVVWYSLAIASELMDTPPYNSILDFPAKVQQAALLHDVGKIGVRDDILLKPEKLSQTEAELINQHPQISEHILRDLKGIPQDVILGIKYHHERYDGGGYSGLKADEVPPIAKILAVADSYDAMTTDRPYRKALPQREVIKEFIKNTYYAGPQWDPVVVEALLAAFKKGRVKENVIFTDEDIEEIKREIEADGLVRLT